MDAQNGVCTQIGNDQFTSFSTTGSKSRLNFLKLLNAGDTPHLINDAGLADRREHHLSQPVLALLAAHATKRFADRTAWAAHLDQLAITALPVHHDPVRIATEGALRGNIAAQGHLDGTVVVADGAGPFDVGHHALCWVHAERLIHELVVAKRARLGPSPGIGAWRKRRSATASGRSTPISRPMPAARRRRPRRS